jgi:phosphatidate cytidylyltransferase
VLKQRLIVGPALAIAALLLFWLDERLERVPAPSWWLEDREHLPGGLVLFLGSLFVLPLAARELASIVRANGIAARTWLMTLSATLGVVLSYAIPTKVDNDAPVQVAVAIAIIPTGMIAMFVLALFTFSRGKNVAGVAAAVGAVIFAMVYLGLMLGFLLAIRRWHSAWWIVGVIAVTKMTDTGAFFTGRAIGRHKLIPWLSPGKTWEGLAGGVVIAVLTGMFVAWLSHFIPPPLDPDRPTDYEHVPIWVGATCGALFAIVGQFGDLTMSLFKRGAGLKDSSNVLPGMGGVLDVMDSPLMVAPVAFWALLLLT